MLSAARKSMQDAAAAAQQQQSSGSDQGHVVTIELVSIAHDHAIIVLELQVVPRPLIIDRTFRCVLHLRWLAGTCTACRR